MATLGAAKALQIESEAGSLERGKQRGFSGAEPTRRMTSPNELAEALIEESRLDEVFIGGKAI